MRILWTTHTPLGKTGQLVEHFSSQSGNWVDAAAESLIKENTNVSLAIATIASHNCKVVENGLTYYGVGGIKRYMGKMPRQKDIDIWKSVILDFQPEVIVVWGTEYSYGYSILKAAENIPVLFYIQGVIGAISQYPYGLLKPKDMCKRVCGIECLKLYFNWKNQRQMTKQKAIEIEMLKQSSGIIADNDWCTAYYRSRIPTLSVYTHSLPIGASFQHDSYQAKKEEHTIFTIAGSGPHKGLHVLVSALRIVVKKYPDTKVFIPGNMEYRQPKWVFQPFYVTYLKKLIRLYGVEDNVVFCGRLSPEEMSEYIQRCAVFVMPSCIENHSSSLREAMIIGAPCISAFVGSVGEFVMAGENGMLYRYEEEFALADNILKLFDDREYAMRLGKNATKIIEKYILIGNGKKMYEIFQNVLCK